jgi:DnaJ domain
LLRNLHELEDSLQAREALDVLALRPGATSAEIKEAYRDLVKVWHPDRFGNDPRLRQKAEAKLKEINEAYDLLQREPVPAETYSASSEGPKSSAYGATYAVPYARPQHWSTRPQHPGTTRSKARSRRVSLVYIACAVLGVLGAVYLFLPRRPAYGSLTAQTSASPMDAANAATAVTEDAGDGGTSSRTVSHGTSAGGKQFRVRALSDAETMQLDAACSPLRSTGEDARYRECVKAQLALMTNATDLPDLNGLNPGERASIDSVCVAARGANAYSHCLAVQMAAVTSEPVRPDLSSLNETDRSTVEFACRNAKYQEGPAAYDRCLVRTLGLLERTR